MTAFVIDASVVIKWLVEEAGTQDAIALQRHRLIAPDLLLAECANILWKKVRRQELLASEAVWAARLLSQAPIELESSRRIMERATRLAISLVHPAYDCLYIALAEISHCDVVTADHGMVRKAAGAGLPITVRLLGETA